MSCADQNRSDDPGRGLPRLSRPSVCLPCWQRLERVPWNTGLGFECQGVRFGIRATDPALRERLFSLLPPGSCLLSSSPVVEELYSLNIASPAPRAGVKNYHLVYRGIERIARTPSLEDALALWESDLHAQIAARARDCLFVHAGVVGWQGRAVVIPGRSFSGKTSLAAALVRCGADYFSDEYAVFDTLGRVHPYPKLLGLRDAAGQPLEQCSAESLGGHVGVSPLPVGLILDTQYAPGARWRPRSMTPGAALLTLLDNTVQIRRRPQWGLDILQQAASGAAAVKGLRGEADLVAVWALTQQRSHWETKK